ncbi:MAG: chemotaxis protein CheW [Solirubrobacteraceae bacterium]|jgi:purine-binding chemotaxis protein CheW
MSTIENTVSGSEQLVIFTLSDEDYALPIAAIKEVIRYVKPRRVASSDHRMSGVITLRGDIVPIADLSMALGVGPDSGEDAKIVIVETATGIAGIVVDAVEEVLTVDGGQIDTETAVDRQSMRGFAKIGERLVVLLDAESLLHGIGSSPEYE